MSRLLEAVLSAGARPAEPGEFTYRAFANGRMDLTQAEAVVSLIGARSERAAQVAAAQLSGALGRAVEGHFAALNRISSHVEAGLDFPDEDLPLTLANLLAEDLGRLASELEALRDSFVLGAKLGHGARIGIVGPPNVGKSSLFNRLVNDERAIVDADPGTTRDVVEAHGVIAGIPVVFLDTAGMREGASRVEEKGIERSRVVVSEADVLILVLDGARPMPEDERVRYEALLSSSPAHPIIALNKNDLPTWREAAPLRPPSGRMDTPVSVSALTGDGVDRLMGALGSALGGDSSEDGVVLTTARQYREVSDTAAHVRAAENLLRTSGEAELAAAELSWAREKIAALLGRSATADMLTSLFSEFCIGK